VRPRVQIPGPRPIFELSISESDRSQAGRRGTGRSQIFLELGGGSAVQVDCGLSIELAHGSRTADISARARSWTVRHLGSKIKGAVHSLCCRRTGQDRDATVSST